MNESLYSILDTAARNWWYHRQLRGQGEVQEARQRERESILDDVRVLRQALENGGFLTHGRGGWTRIILDENYMLEITRHGFRICPYAYDDLAKDYVENIYAGSVILAEEAMLKLFALVAQLIIEGILATRSGDGYSSIEAPLSNQRLSTAKLEQLATAARQVCDLYDIDPDVQEVGGQPLEVAMELLLDAVNAVQGIEGGEKRCSKKTS